jgi:hypothetical protein
LEEGLLSLGLLAVSVAQAERPAAKQQGKATATPAGLAGQRVHIDPQTGKIREPEQEESQQLSDQMRRMSGPSAKQLKAVRHPNGMLTVDTQGAFLSYSVAKVNADGTVSQKCVRSLDEANAWRKAPGTPLLTVNSPPAIAGIYQVGTASFGPPLASPGITGNVVLATDGVGTTTDACEALTNGPAIAGNIALVDRGTCTFVIKVKNAQDAGAIAVLIADNVAGSPPPGPGGSDATIVIPSARITLADGNTIKAQLPAGVNATLGMDLTVLAGADPSGKALLWSPNPVQSGSSISHWDQIASPNQLMEPAINSDLTHEVDPPEDLTLPLLLDIGWTTGGGVDDCPVSNTDATVSVAGCQTEAPNIMFSNGCSLADLLALCADGAASHGDYVSCVAGVSNGVNQGGGISGAHKGQIQSCAAGAAMP